MRKRKQRRILIGALLALVMGQILMVPSSFAQITTDSGDGNIGPGYVASDNVEYIKTIPVASDGVGARIVGHWLYVTSTKDLQIYDISEPTDPVLTGQLTLPEFENEDVSTNGDILLISASLPADTLYVIDVSDKSNPHIISKVPEAGDHTQTCVLNCQYAYGSDGTIVDLRDPQNPEIVGDWSKGLEFDRSGHDVFEVSPGLVVTASQPIYYLDARKDPVHPTVLATGSNEDDRFIHTAFWPNGGKDKFLLVTGETNFQPQCSDNNGAFMTWDAKDWRKDHKFTMIDEYRVENGTVIDGNPPANALGCSSHWLEARPSFHNGGIVAVAFYEHGTRFLRVSPEGKISEVGYFEPLGGATSAPHWVNDHILYAIDYTRGIDILRFTGETGPVPPAPGPGPRK